jgi:tetratricopeptide (TPR) repeat protein
MDSSQRRVDSYQAHADAQALFAEAVRRHQANDLPEAERLYLAVIDRKRDFNEAHYNLAILLASTGRPVRAIASYRRALSLNPNNADAYNNLGILLGAHGRAEDAVACFRNALEHRPDYPAVHSNLGNALKELGRLDEATASYRAALALRPDYAEAENNLGNTLREQGRFAEAADHHHRAIALKPDYAAAHNGLGIALKDLNRPDEAIACYRTAIRLDPDDPDPHNNLGNALLDLGHPLEAVASYRSAIRLRPDYALAHGNLGTALLELGQLEDAVASFRTALALNPGSAAAHNNFGIAQMRLGRSSEAIIQYRRAIALNPEYAEAHSNLAMALLGQGDFAEGWPEYEWRWKTPDLNLGRRDFSQPQWRGEPAAGQTLLIHAEQGFGDTLQFCRYAPLVAARGLRVVLEVPGPLVRLLQSLPGVESVIRAGEPLPRFDLHCPMLSLPLALGTTLDSIPNATPYLTADPARAEAWRVRLEATGARRPRIGLVWAGNSRAHLPQAASIDRRRSIDPDRLAQLFELPDLQFFSLQKDGPAAPSGFPLIDLMSEMADFADTAALVVQLDLVISVDTAVAHLAAALGRPVWLLDRFDPCWRWLTGRRDSPWYPTLRLFRQPEPGDWGPVVQQVQSELRTFARELMPPPETIQRLFADAVQHHRAGRLTEAEARYRQITAVAPRHADALHLLGVIAGQQERHEQAIALIRRAVAIDPRAAPFQMNLGIALKRLARLDEAADCFRVATALAPNDAVAHNTLGLVLEELGRLDEAIGCFRRAHDLRPDDPKIRTNLARACRVRDLPDGPVANRRHAVDLRPEDPEAHNDLGIALRFEGRLEEAVLAYRAALHLRPEYAEAHNNLANALRAQGHLDAAVASLREALALKPEYPEAYSNLGIALQAQGKLDEAAASYRQALAIRPDIPETQNNLGNALREQGRLEDAVACYHAAIALRPGFAEAHNGLGVALQKLWRPDEASACYRRAIDLRPDYSEAHNNLGTALQEQGQPDEAVASIRRALVLRPDFAEAHSSLGTALQEQRRLDEAIACFRRAIALNPDYPDAHTNLGMALLAQGDWTAGWQEYEWRWKTSDFVKTGRAFGQPLWRGEAADGRTVLIHAEQGFGDTLQFCRYLPLVAARGLRVIVEAPGPLVRLLRSMPGVERVVQPGEALPDFDLHCPLLSLPLALGTTLATVPAAVPYLQVDPAQAAVWQARIAGLARSGPRIGLVWAGSPGKVADVRRSLPPERLAPLFGLAGLHFFSLQKDGPAAPGRFPLTDCMKEMTDFADTAALVVNLDLVISVDTAVAHLAGALGRPVWVLDRYDPCWRWLAGRRDSPWYPTLRIYRQPQPGDWEPVLAQVVRDLRNELLRQF